MSIALDIPCALCGRLTKRGTNEHHLIPRTCHRNKWFRKNFSRAEMNTTVDLCRDCHGAIHDLVPSEKELGRQWNTVEKLLDHPEIGKFVAWAKRQR